MRSVRVDSKGFATSKATNNTNRNSSSEYDHKNGNNNNNIRRSSSGSQDGKKNKRMSEVSTGTNGTGGNPADEPQTNTLRQFVRYQLDKFFVEHIPVDSMKELHGSCKFSLLIP